MTYPDPALVDARNYLIGLGIPGNSIGIVGDQSHRATGGYHVGNDVLAMIGKLFTDYSKRQTEKDRPGSDAAMALDVGGLSARALSDLTNWLIAQCRAGTADTRNIREIIGRRTPAGGVTRYDALGILADSGSSDHETHTHISYYRDSEGTDKTAVFRRYYEPAPPPSTPHEEDDMGVMFHAIDDQGTQITSDDAAVFAHLAGGVLKVTDYPVPQTLANKVAVPPNAPDKGTGNSSPLTKAEWNAFMDWFDVVGHRFVENADGTLGDWVA